MCKQALALCIALLLVSGPPSVSEAQEEGTEVPPIEAETPPVREPRHCLNSEGPKWILNQLFAAQFQPTGAENSFRLGLCLPLFTEPHVLFDYTSIEFGITNYVSPAFGVLGAYVQITPLSLLQLRAEYNGLVYWPFVTDRAGYFPLSGYDADFRSEVLPQEDAEVALGSNLNLIATLRARVGFGPNVGLLLLSSLSFEYWEVGDAEYYYNLRRELPLAQSDWFLSNELILAAEIVVSDDFRFRVGGYDALRYVFESGYVSNQVGILVMGYWPTPGGIVKELSPLLRVGVHTHHAFREGQVSLLGGLLVSYELGAL